MEKTIVCSIVGLNDPKDEERLREKLCSMPHVSDVTLSGTEGRVVITGEDLNQKVFIQAIEQFGVDVISAS